MIKTDCMRKGAITSVILVLALLPILTVANLQTTSGNPTFIWDQPINGGVVAPDNKTKPPTIQLYFENNTESRNNSLSIPIYINVGDSSTAQSRRLEEIYYQADWLSSNTTIYKFIVSIYNSSNYKPPNPTITYLSTTINLTDVPEGNHKITLYANETGEYRSSKYSSSANYTFNYYYGFRIIGASTLNFTVDTIAPVISSISIENKTYYSANLPLSFMVDDESSQFQYSIDNQSNVTLTSNTTLAGLTDGSHTLTIFATDSFGNVGIEAVTFTVTPFSITIAVASAIALVVGIVIALFLIKRHRKIISQNNPNV
jgi:hypothetical protein